MSINRALFTSSEIRACDWSTEALANMQGEDIMLGIYDNIHDELRDTRRRLNNEKDKVRRPVQDQGRHVHNPVNYTYVLVCHICLSYAIVQPYKSMIIAIVQ